MKSIKEQVWDLADHLMENIHGSGIDSEWKKVYSPSFAIIKNSYHCLNEQGYYDGWQDFSIKIPLDGDLGEMKLIFHGDGKLASKHMLRDYLEDLFWNKIKEWLEGYPCKHTIQLHKSFGPTYNYPCLVPALLIKHILENQGPNEMFRVIRIDITYPDK